MPDNPLTPEQAQAFLMQNVYAPAFFDKLAAHGIVPGNEDEANCFLEMAAKLQSAHQVEKQASAGSRLGFFQQANAACEMLIG